MAAIADDAWGHVIVFRVVVSESWIGAIITGTKLNAAMCVTATQCGVFWVPARSMCFIVDQIVAPLRILIPRPKPDNLNPKSLNPRSEAKKQTPNPKPFKP